MRFSHEACVGVKYKRMLFAERPEHDLGLEVWPIVIQNDVQLLRGRVTAPHPLQKRQELDPGLAFGETAIQAVGLQVVEGQKVTHTALTGVGRTQALHPAPVLAGQAVSMPWLQVERPELI